ncbi:MAG: hypothetical protein JWP12_2214 [Bacteroidetes bacterium]|nr:hypothetical protein [Bacteroidota bacterium]
MAEQHVFFGKTINGPSLKGMIENKLLSGKSNPVELNFENGDKALLDPVDPQAASWVKMIGYLQKNNRPVYVETEAGTITNVSAPEVAGIWEIWDVDEKNIYVSFYTSTALHYLRRDRPGFQKMLDALQSAVDKKIPLLVTSTYNDFEIIDVRDLPADLANDELLQSLRSPETAGIIEPEEDEKVVSLERAKELFDRMKWKSCIPDASGDPCIPFMYPSNGCWIRAHLMCYFLREEKETPKKIWSSGQYLRTRSTNVPGCIVKWTWHVAATLMVEDESGEIIKMVFDPSMCGEPVPVQKWLDLQTDPEITYRVTEWDWYKFWGGSATKEEANIAMDEFRDILENMWAKNGFPPYECTP